MHLLVVGGGSIGERHLRCFRKVRRSLRITLCEQKVARRKEMARKLGLVSMVGIPLQLKDERVIGVLNCFTASPHDFSDTEINLLTAVANQAAVAILNTELMVQTRVIQEELETRKMVERAKEALMNQRDLNSADAYRWIQKRSMDSRKSMRQIAEAILLSQDIYPQP